MLTWVISSLSGVKFILTGARFSYVNRRLSLQLAWIIMFKITIWYYYFTTIQVYTYEVCSLEFHFTLSAFYCSLQSAVFVLHWRFSVWLPAKRKWNLSVFVRYQIIPAIKKYLISQSWPFHKITKESLNYIEQLNYTVHVNTCTCKGKRVFSHIQFTSTLGVTVHVLKPDIENHSDGGIETINWNIFKSSQSNVRYKTMKSQLVHCNVFASTTTSSIINKLSSSNLKYFCVLECFISGL